MRVLYRQSRNRIVLVLLSHLFIAADILNYFFSVLLEFELSVKELLLENLGESVSHGQCAVLQIELLLLSQC